MNDDARALLDHRWQQSPVEANGAHQVQVDFTLPDVVIDLGKSTARSARSADDIDQNIYPAEIAKSLLGDHRAALGSRNVAGNVVDARRWPLRLMTSGSHYSHTSMMQRLHDGSSDALGRL